MEKRITSPLMEPSSIEKIVEVDSHIGCAMSGLTADARTMIDRARVEAQNYWFTYNEPMPVESVTQAVRCLFQRRLKYISCEFIPNRCGDVWVLWFLFSLLLLDRTRTFAVLRASLQCANLSIACV